MRSETAKKQARADDGTFDTGHVSNDTRPAIDKPTEHTRDKVAEKSSPHERAGMTKRAKDEIISSFVRPTGARGDLNRSENFPTDRVRPTSGRG